MILILFIIFKTEFTTSFHFMIFIILFLNHFYYYQL